MDLGLVRKILLAQADVGPPHGTRAGETVKHAGGRHGDDWVGGSPGKAVESGVGGAAQTGCCCFAGEWWLYAFEGL